MFSNYGSSNSFISALMLENNITKLIVTLLNYLALFFCKEEKRWYVERDVCKNARGTLGRGVDVGNGAGSEERKIL